MTTVGHVASRYTLRKAIEREMRECDDCPPSGYPTDKTRCMECPRREIDRAKAAREVGK